MKSNTKGREFVVASHCNPDGKGLNLGGRAVYYRYGAFKGKLTFGSLGSAKRMPQQKAEDVVRALRGKGILAEVVPYDSRKMYFVVPVK